MSHKVSYNWSDHLLNILSAKTLRASSIRRYSIFGGLSWKLWWPFGPLLLHPGMSVKFFGEVWLWWVLSTIYFVWELTLWSIYTPFNTNVTASGWLWVRNPLGMERVGGQSKGWPFHALWSFSMHSGPFFFSSYFLLSTFFKKRSWEDAHFWRSMQWLVLEISSFRLEC